MSDWFQWAVIAFIVLSILYHVWKGGSANPVGTAKLQHDVTNVRTQVTGLGSRVGHLETAMEKLEREAATSEDIGNLEKLFDERLRTVRTEIEGHRSLSQATNDSVRRIERIIIEKGLGAK